MSKEINNNNTNNAKYALFLKLFMKNQSNIFGFILRLIPNFSIAEDIMQETMMTVWQKFASFEQGTDFLSWAKQIARYKVMGYIDKSKSHSMVHFSDNVLEELAKVPEMNGSLQSGKFRNARFQLYTIEQKIVSRILRTQSINKITGVYVILDTKLAGTRDIVDCARQSLAGGARIIQLRDKLHEKETLIPIAQQIKDLCKKSDALFIINDYLDLALAVDSDGLHLGQSDLPLAVARKALHVDKIIGRSTHSIEQALLAVEEGADYIGVGSIFSTNTKENANIIGIDVLRTVRQAVSVPIVAIGGINKNNIIQVKQAGADSAAVISAVFSEDTIKNAVGQMVKEIEREL